MRKLFLIALAGALGTLARYWLAGTVSRYQLGDFPWGTLTVNAIGSLLFGFVWTLSVDRSVIDPETRTILLGGFMGAFTTFSTFAFETGRLVESSQWGLVFANLLAQVVLGLAGVLLGSAAARAL